MSASEAAQALDAGVPDRTDGAAEPGRRRSRSAPPPPPPRPVRLAMAAVLGALGLWVAWTAGQLLLADALSVSARSHVRQWSLGTLAARDAEVAAAEADIRRALRLHPDDPTLWEDLGEAQVLLAKRAGAELMRRNAAPAAQAASAAIAASAAQAASRPAQSLEEFRQRVKAAELEAQRKSLRASAPETAPTPPPATPSPRSTDELKVALRSHFEAARDAYLRAIELRPSWSTVWVRLAGVYLGLEQRPLYLQAWQQALKLGPFEGNVQAECLELVLLDWDQAAPEQTEWAKKLFDAAPADKRKAINSLAARYGLQFQGDDEAPAPR